MEYNKVVTLTTDETIQGLIQSSILPSSQKDATTFTARQWREGNLTNDNVFPQGGKVGTKNVKKTLYYGSMMHGDLFSKTTKNDYFFKWDLRP